MRLLRHFLPLSLLILLFLAPLLALAVPTGFNSDAQSEYYSYDYDDISPPDYDHVSLHSFCLVWRSPDHGTVDVVDENGGRIPVFKCQK